VGDVVSMVQEQARAKRLSLSTELDALPPNLFGDATRLQQALLNYVTNAVKFTDAGNITMRVHRQEETPDSILLRFEVEDTGVGIAEDALPRLFNAFEQADNSSTRKYGGSGLAGQSHQEMLIYLEHQSVVCSVSRWQ
jgi:two-component system sensor histidine kinase/response regulator